MAIPTTRWRMETVDRGALVNNSVYDPSRPIENTSSIRIVESVSSQNPKDRLNLMEGSLVYVDRYRIPFTMKLFLKGLVWVVIGSPGDENGWMYYQDTRVAPGSVPPTPVDPLNNTIYDYMQRRYFGGMFVDQSQNNNV